MKDPMGTSRTATPRATRRGRGDSGAALVEMAIVATLLFALLFGMIDFGWAFTKNLDVRHGAREVGRLAAVNFDDTSVPGTTQGQRIVNAACDRMDGDASTSVTLDLSSDSSSVTVTVTQTFDSITGFYDNALPETLNSTVRMRMEQTQSFDTDTSPNTYVCGVSA
jgi:Flp pilus assembly protein TadG